MTDTPLPSKRERQNAKREARYKRSQEARARIEARLSRVLDRVIVAATFSSYGGGTVAQTGHALRFARWGDNEDESLPPMTLGDDQAEALVGIVATLFQQAFRRHGA